MDSPTPLPITEMLDLARGGDESARDRLLTSIYDELRGLARGYLQSQQPGHTLQATALVNEVCLRLLSREGLPGANRVQFRAFVAKAMRNLLIDHARERGRLKRGGKEQCRVPFDDGLVVSEDPSIDFLALDESLGRLSEVDERKGRVVELRYFGGMSIDEIAAALDTSPATVKRDWDVARTWLFADMNGRDSAQPRGRDSAQPRGRDSAQPRGRDSAQPRGRDSAQPRGRSEGPRVD